MRILLTGLMLSLAALLPLCPALAQTAQRTLIVGAGNLQITNDQKLMLEAANKFITRDYAAAENLYTQALAVNSGNVDAYLQRAAVRREMHNANGMASDAKMAVTLADSALQQNPNDPNLYYRRGMGYRLLGQFDQARSDIASGMRIGGPDTWNTDLEAIELERRASR